jgi:DNA-binding NarL/FixJ family response regulator
VLIVDDEPILRDVARMACEAHPGVEVVGESAGGHDAVEKALGLQPDIILLDLDLADIDGFEVSRRLRREGCPAQILGTTGEGGPSAVFHALRVGIGGYLDKLRVARGLSGAIDALSSGARTFTPDDERGAIREFGTFLRRAREGGEATRAVTAREKEVLRMIAEGLTTRQIASRLGLSERTIESHLTKAYRKLGVRTRVQAVTRAVEVGIADLHHEGAGSGKRYPAGATGE